MEIILGRDAATNRIKALCNGQVKYYGSQGSVPNDVSREHCSITINDKTVVIKNIKATNVTYVNGVDISSKSVTDNDKVELGQSRYVLPIKDILNDNKEATCDIAKLQQIWNDYEQTLLKYQISERKFSTARSCVGLVTMGAMICGILLERSFIYILLYVLAIVISAVFAYVAYKKASQIPVKMVELKRDLQKNYVCTNCGHFMGFIDAEILKQNKSCSHCKAKFTE